MANGSSFMLDLSIIVPIYNVEGYLDECLASIEAALTPEFSAEVLCINDGSSDGSEQIARTFAQRDSRFQLINQVNGGYGKAINSGMQAASGRFFTIVESDDVITPTAYKLLLELLHRDDSLDFVKTPYQPFTVKGPLQQVSVPSTGLRAADLLHEPSGVAVRANTFVSDRLIFEPPAIWAGVYRMSALKRYKIKLPETPGAGYQDTCFSAMCFLNGMTYHWVNDRYYMYRIDREAASRHVRNRRSEIIGLFHFISENLERNGRLTETAMPYFYAVYFRRLIWFMQRVRTEHRFTLFYEAYRSFEEVWEDPDLRIATQNLLPPFEAEQFEQFWQGRYQRLYAA